MVVRSGPVAKVSAPARRLIRMRVAEFTLRACAASRLRRSGAATEAGTTASGLRNDQTSNIPCDNPTDPRSGRQPRRRAETNRRIALPRSTTHVAAFLGQAGGDDGATEPRSDDEHVHLVRDISYVRAPHPAAPSRPLVGAHGQDTRHLRAPHLLICKVRILRGGSSNACHLSHLVQPIQGITPGARSVHSARPRRDTFVIAIRCDG